MLWYFRCHLCFCLFFLLPRIFAQFLLSAEDGRSTIDNGWENNENRKAEYGKRGHSFGSRSFEKPLLSEWGRSAHTDLFRPSKSYPLNNKGYDLNLPISYRPSLSNFKQSSSYTSYSLRPQVPACNVVIDKSMFHLHSPNYPTQQYPANFHCLYNIKRTLGSCSVELDIRDFYLEPTVSCSRDWLLVNERKYCGLHRPRKLIVPFREFNDVKIEFRSDYQNQFRGFYIVGRQIPCARIPTKTLVIKNPFQPPLSLLIPAPTHSHTTRAPVRLPPATYEIKQPKIPPSYPSLHTTLKPSLPHLPSTYFPPFPQPLPTYTHHKQPPIVPPVPALCDLTFNTPQGQFQSLNYPENYASNLFCELRFIPPTGYCILELYFQDFQLEDSKGCKKDALIIGGNRYCSSSLTGQRLRITFVSRTSISLQFVTDSEGKARGYNATYRMLACEDITTTSPPYTTPTGVTCDRVFAERENSITSVNYPLPYLKNLDCTYLIDKWSPIVDELEISFVAFDLQNSTDCRSDFLDISGERYCGVQTGLTLRVPFTGNYQFEIRFHSDSTVQNTGFNISVIQLDKQATTAPPPTTPPAPASSYCQNEIFILSNFLLISPQFPLLYLPGQQCSYIITKTSQEVCELQLKFTFFSLPGDSDNCKGDYLQIENNRLCGDLTGQTRKVPFNDQQIEISFISDMIDNYAQEEYSGYSIHVVQLTDCTSPYLEMTKSLMQLEGALCQVPLIPGYEVNSADFQLQNNRDCGYIINQEQDACGVEIHFNEFYITPSVNCSENYLEVDNRHFCGQQMDNMRIDVRFPVGDRPIHLPFHIAQQNKFFWTINTSLISCYKMRKQCSPSIWSAEGTFQYSAHSNFKRTECDFVIRRWNRRICRLQLDFVNFNISDNGNNCDSNYLDVDGKKLCGNITGRKTSIEFSSLEDFALLKLDHVSDVDLEVRVQQIQCR